MTRFGCTLVWLAVWVVSAAHGGEAAAPGDWRDCLAGQPVEVAGAAAATLVEVGREAFDLEVEVRWTAGRRAGGGGFELGFGPHAVGSDGYRFVASRRPWRTVESRGPRLVQNAWHRLAVAVRAAAAEYRLADELVVRCPVAGGRVGAVRVAAAAGATVAVRRCRLRAAAAGDGVATGGTRLVYAAEGFVTSGNGSSDGSARGGRSVRAHGRGEGRWLVGGQDASLPSDGRYVAAFGLRGLSGTGQVWLEVARSGGGVLAATALRLEELPRDGYARVALAFAGQAGQPLEYRVAAEGGSLLLDDVAVGPADPARGAQALAGRPMRRARHAGPLGQVWPQAATQDARGLDVVALRRRLGKGGWYEFQALWRQGRAGRLDGVAVDLWVACRDRWGRVRVLGRGSAYDGVAPGEHATSAWLGPRDVERYGWPVGLFARLYVRGQPGAKAWRKWGVPVADQWILPAEVVGRLRASPTE